MASASVIISPYTVKKYKRKSFVLLSRHVGECDLMASIRGSGLKQVVMEFKSKGEHKAVNCCRAP